MKFIESNRLTRLNVILQHVDLGDRIVSGRLELFDTSTKLEAEKEICEEIDKELHQTPKWLSKSPVGPLEKQDAKDLLVNLISSMNQCFPDYDFSNLSPASFKHEKDFATVYDNIQYNLGSMVDRVMPGLLQDVWTTIRDNISLTDADIYSYSFERGSEADPFSTSDSVFSFDYFFCSRKQKRALFFSCVTRSKFNNGCADSGDEDDFEVPTIDESLLDGARSYIDPSDDDELADGEIEFRSP